MSRPPAEADISSRYDETSSIGSRVYLMLRDMIGDGRILPGEKLLEMSIHQLKGCQQDVRNMTQFLISRGYPSDEKSMVILTDARQGPFYPSGKNILAAMDWLVSESGTQCFLHYSGHGGQVEDPDGDRES